jgi:hypothetical protein
MELGIGLNPPPLGTPLTWTTVLILIPCIIDYIEINKLNALKLYNSLFSFTIAPTCSVPSQFAI